MKKWRVTSSKMVLKNKFYNVRRDSCLTAKNKLIKEYYVKEGRGSAVVFALTRKNKILLEEQYRHGVKKISWDLPCGRIEKGETPKQTAQRELLEETGYRAKTLISLGKLAYSPSNSEEYFHIFLAQDIKYQPGTTNRDNGEDAEIHLVSLEKLKKYMAKRKINCSLCLSAIFLSLEYLKNTKQKYGTKK